jgi:hypothetical protein
VTLNCGSTSLMMADLFLFQKSFDLRTDDGSRIWGRLREDILRFTLLWKEEREKKKGQ